MNVGQDFGRAIEILLVEDSPTDAVLTKSALEKGRIRNNIHHVEDGVEAMAFVKKEGAYADVPRPDLILLDLNMPRKDGREVLAELKTIDDLKKIPVIVLTTSSAHEDIDAAYTNMANCYITKPVDMKQFVEAVHLIEQFWFAVVELPSD